MTREERCWADLCKRLQRDPVTSEESDTCTLRVAFKHALAFADAEAAAMRERAAPSSERQRYITTWRKRPPESVLDWDHYVSEDDAELAGVIKNLKAQGVKQWNTFRLGERVASLSSEH